MPAGVVNFCPGGPEASAHATRRASEDALHRLHRLEGSRPRNQRARGKDAAGPKLDQAHGPGDGRQGFHHRRCRRRHGRCRRRRRRMRHSASTGRSARPARARSLTRTIYDAFLERLRGARGEDHGRRSGETNPTWARWSTRSAMKSDSAATSRSARAKAALITGGEPAGDAGRRLLHPADRDRRCRARRHASRRKRFSARCSRSSSRRITTKRLQIANNTEYGLTGAVYTRDRRKLERARREFPCRQSLFQSQVHRRHGRRASVRRLQHVRHGFKSRRPGLSAALHAGKIRRGENRRSWSC